MHGAFLNMDSEKMSKSLGNFHTLRDVLGKLDSVQGGEATRFFLLRGHYRSEINFSWEALEDAGNTLRGFYTALREVKPGPRGPIDWNNDYARRFRDAMNDDFDTPVAFAVLHDLRGEVNRTKAPELAALLRRSAAPSDSSRRIPKPSSRARRPAAWTCRRRAIERRAQAAKAPRDYARPIDPQGAGTAGIVLEDKPGGITDGGIKAALETITGQPWFVFWSDAHGFSARISGRAR
jgi:cysteinyl-tRNA synthetase